MDFSFTQDQLLFRDAVADLFKKECPPDVVRACWNGDLSGVDAIWQKLAEQGVFGLAIPEAAGGLGLGLLDLVLLLEAAGYVAYPAPFAETAAMAAPVLTLAGEETWLPKIATGQARIAVALSGGYVPWAADVDAMLLSRDGHLYLATPAQVKLAPQEAVDRSRRLCHVDWTPDGLTMLGDGALVAAVFWHGVVATSAQLIGLAQAMLDLTVDYAKTRKQFGKPIGSFQAIKHHLSDALLKLSFARPMVYRAAYSLVHDDPEQHTHAGMAKHYTGEAAAEIAKIALQCHGAIGYTIEYDLHMWMKRVWALEKAFGDAAWHRQRIADTILETGTSVPV